MTKKFLTEYLIEGSVFNSFIYAKNLKQANSFAKKRDIKEKVIHEIKNIPEEKPSDLFLKKQYKECAHALCYLLFIRNNNLITKKSLRDDGILHEVIHLINDIEIFTHSSLDIVYNNIVTLENSTIGYKNENIKL